MAWYDDKIFFKHPLPDAYASMSRADLYRALGCSDRLYYFWECFEINEDERVRVEIRKLPNGDDQCVWHTPVGNQTAIYRSSPHSRWPEPVKWPIIDEQDMKVAIWRTQRQSWYFNQSLYDQLVRELGDLGAPTTFICHTTIQHLFVKDMGVEAAIYALMDYPALCERYFEALDLKQEKHVDAILDSPIKILNFGDNIHAGVTTPDLFTRYVQPAYLKRCEEIHRAGKWVNSHWDGDVKALLPFARECGLDGIEAITPKPQGDVTLEQAKAGLGEDVFLLDGIPAVYFDATYPEQELIDCAKKCLDLFAPKLILGISDEISATGDIERVRLVGQIVDDYNASL